MWSLVHELPLTRSYLHFDPFECSRKMQSRLYAHPWTPAYIWALFLPDPCLHFPSDWRSSGCSLFQELSHQSLSVQAGPSQSPVSVELFRLSCILCCIASLPSFLSCAHWEHFLSNPHSACSLSQPWTLPLFPFLSMLPLRLCYCIL